MSKLTPAQERLAQALIDIQALKFGAFKIKLHQTNPDAPLSPVYLDLRVLRSYPDAVDAAVDALQEITARLQFDLLADVPTGSTPFVAVLSNKIRTGMVSPRMVVKGYGSGNRVDGAYQAGQRVLVVDDVVTTAGSKIEAIEILTAAGLQVQDVLVLVDRHQGGKAELAKHSYTLHSVMGFDQLLEYARDSGAITPERYTEVQAYMDANRPESERTNQEAEVRR